MNAPCASRFDALARSPIHSTANCPSRGILSQRIVDGGVERLEDLAAFSRLVQHGVVDPFECRVHRPPGLQVHDRVELIVEHLRQRLVDDEACPVVPVAVVACVELRARPLHHVQRVLSPEQTGVQRLRERHRTLDAERELRPDDQRDAGRVDGMGEARARDHHRSHVAAVAARDGDDRGAMTDAHDGADEAFAGHDVGRPGVVAHREAVRLLRHHVEVAVRQDVDVRVGLRAALALQFGERRVDENGQQIAELLARVGGLARGLVAIRILERLDRRNERGPVLEERDVVRIAGDEEHPRPRRPHHVIGRHRADVARERDGRTRLDRDGRSARSDRHLRELERQERELGGRQREPQMHERVALVAVRRELAGEARHRLEHPSEIRPDLVQHVEPIALVARLVAQLLEAPLEHTMLVRNTHHVDPRLVADAEILRVGREQLVVRASRTEELDIHAADANRAGHGCHPLSDRGEAEKARGYQFV